MQDSERLSPRELLNLAPLLSERKAEPGDARRLLEEFVARVTAREQVPEELLGAMRDAIAGYLSDTYKTLDNAFLVKGRRGNPGADESREFEIARAILECRMNDLSHEDALGEVSKQFACGPTKASNAWKRKREDVFYGLRLIRSLRGEGLTAQELERAREIAGVKPYVKSRISNRAS